MKKQIKTKKVSKFVYWTPRILSILFLLFLALFSLDIFDSCNTFLNCSIGLFMHNIPVFILAIILYFSWKYEIVGAIAFILAGLLYIVSVLFRMEPAGFQFYYLLWIIQIAGPAFLVGILFWLNWKNKKK